MLSVNWLTLLLLLLAVALIRLAVSGRYAQAWGALSSFPLTPAQAQQQASQQASQTETGLHRIG